MAKPLHEMETDEEADARAEHARFEELADQYRQQGHLPPQGDQSWREREAMRLATYDKGHIPPQNDQSWRDREAMLFAPASEEDAAGTMADASPQMREPVLRPVPAPKGGQGGTVLIFLLVAAIAFGIAALAYPEMLTAGYWRTQGAQTGAVQPPPRAVQPPAIQPAAPPLEQSPPLTPAPELKRTPAEPAPSVQEAPPPLVIDAAPKPASAPERAVHRASARDNRGTGGFYAKVPGPDGVLRDTFFPADPKSDLPARKQPAVPAAPSEGSGFYAKAPGPDGRMELRYFPSKPPPPR